MARGRKPKPIELRDAEGNLARRPLPAPLSTEPIDPTPPAVLGPAGCELWVDLVERLGSVGVLDRVDRVGLIALCLQWDRAETAGRVLKEQGHYARGSMGQVVAHPALAEERKALNAVVKFAAEYAATPVARARVATANAARDQQREFEELTSGDIEDNDAAVIDGDEL